MAEDASSADLREVLKAQTVVIHRLQDRVIALGDQMRDHEADNTACMVTLSQKQEAQKRQLQRIDARLDTIFKQITEGHNRVEDLQESYGIRLDGYAQDFADTQRDYDRGTRSTFNTMHDRITRAESAVKRLDRKDGKDGGGGRAAIDPTRPVQRNAGESPTVPDERRPDSEWLIGGR